MDPEQEKAEEMVDLAVTLVDIAGILVAPVIARDDLARVASRLARMKDPRIEIDPAISAAVVEIATAVAVRAARFGVDAGVTRAEVKKFGNSGHVIVPGTLIGREVFYAPVPEDGDDPDIDTLFI